MTDLKAFLGQVLLSNGSANCHRVKVTLTFAQSIDAKIAGRSGKQLILSCQESMLMTHRLRSMHDAILVGIGTALNDDPQLNTRLLPTEDGQQTTPLPIILDSKLRLRPDCKLIKNFLSHGGRQPIIFTSEVNAKKEDPDWIERRSMLDSKGIRIIPIPSDDGKLSLPSLLTHLEEMRVQSLMVEGGAEIITSFMQSGLIDVLLVTTSPCFVGPDGTGYVGTGLNAQFDHHGTTLVGRDAVTAWRGK